MTLLSPMLLFFLALAVPVLLLWYHSVRLRQERISRFAESAFTGKLLSGYSRGLGLWRFWMVFAAMILMLFSLAAPMIIGGRERVKKTGIDVVIALDISNSMRANDIKPSRLESVKLALSDMIAKMGDDRLGLVIFAGQAYTSVPLTQDHSAAQMVVQSLDPDMISLQGTAIGNAIEQSLLPFRDEDTRRGKAIILISDGENHEDDPIAATKKAVEKNVIVNTIGIGSDAGAKIPLYTPSGDFIENKKDGNGQEIVTKLDEKTLRDIAKEGHGIYVRATQSDIGIDKVYDSLRGLNKSTEDAWRYTDLSPLYRWFLLGAIVILLAEMFIPEGKRKEILKRS
ncbi:MAG TPA: VWA domain-containing protein [Bacteroidia bacterium]|nr:VWA domain-containing protein [Bacteroidia bacterium]